jgi:hypothetical protein
VLLPPSQAPSAEFNPQGGFGQQQQVAGNNQLSAATAAFMQQLATMQALTGHNPMGSIYARSLAHGGQGINMGQAPVPPAQATAQGAFDQQQQQQQQAAALQVMAAAYQGSFMEAGGMARGGGQGILQVCTAQGPRDYLLLAYRV